MDTRIRAADVRVGLFVVAALAILIFGSLWVAGSTFLRVEQNAYRVLMESSAGIEAGDRVRFAGVKVGRITAVSLEPEAEYPVVMEVSIDPEIPVRTDSTARIASSGIMGGSFLVIEAGSPDAALLRDGGAIHGEAAQGMEKALDHVDAIAVKALELLDQVSQVLDQVSTDLGPILIGAQDLLSERNVENIGDILANLDGILEEAAPRITSLLTRLDALAAKLEEGADDVPELTGELTAMVEDLRAALGPEGERLVGLLDSAQQMMDSADRSLGVLNDNRDELEWMIRDFRDTAANLEALSQRLKEQPSSLVFAKPDPDRKPGDGVEGSR
jgi:phospholipid/cholesterol/gamma-HCH transport system substrate-binding protein